MTLPAFPKPHQAEGIVTLTPVERRAKRTALYHAQQGMCACGCGQRMVLEPYLMNSVTLEHRVPNKMGCRKQDADSNLCAYRFDCNAKKGSQRI